MNFTVLYVGTCVYRGYMGTIWLRISKSFGADWVTRPNSVKRDKVSLEQWLGRGRERDHTP